ncbi:MAG: substrate-binding domain-containing protein [Anaerolineales bacterium]|nr:substrate-binding domain-containing protein [Anaerolineales bacterium]
MTDLSPRLPEMLALLERLVETESPSHDKAAVDRVGAIVAEECRRLGAQVEIHSQFPLGTLAKMPFQFSFFLLTFLLSTIPLLTSCSPTPPAAIPEAITVQYTAAAQPWLMEAYDCAGVNTVIAELRAANYLEFNHNTLSMRIGEPLFLTAPVYQIGSEEIVIVVNPQNQIGDLATENVRSIFSGRITRWDELGGKEAAVQVWVFASGEDLQQVFDAQVLGGMPVTSHARLAASPQEMINAIAADGNAIGILTRRWMENNLREVFASASVPVLVITSSEPQGTIQALISCLQK